MLKYGKGVRGAVGLLSAAALVSGAVFVGSGPAQAATSTLVSVKSLSVTKGSTAGGTTTLITGKGFLSLDTATAAAAVKFGANNATSYIVLSDTQIAATAPAGAAATIDVVLTEVTTLNTSAVGTASKFTYLAPITATVAASTLVSSLGGSVITVGTGSFDLGASAAAFIAKKVTATVNGAAAPLKWVSASSANLTVPAGTPSSTAVKVMLYNQGVSGTADSTNATYVAVISKLSVTSGPVAGGGTVTVTGKGFTGGGTWKFGTVAATCTISKDTTASCTVPAAASSAAGAVSVNFVPASSAPYGTLAGATYTYSDVS